MVHGFCHSGSLFQLSISEMGCIIAAIDGEQGNTLNTGIFFICPMLPKLMKIPLDTYGHDLIGTASLKK